MSEVISRIAESVAQLRRIRSHAHDGVARRRANILLVYFKLRSQRMTARTLGHARSTVQTALEEFTAFGL